MNLLDAEGNKIKTNRSTAVGVTVPFRSSRHVLECATACHLIWKNIDDSEVKTMLQECLDDFAERLDAWKEEGRPMELTLGEQQQVVENTPPSKLDLV